MHTVSTGLAAFTAAALTVTTSIPAAGPAPRTASERAIAASDAQAITIPTSAATTATEAIAVPPSDPKSAAVVETAVAQASGALLEADHVTAEGAGAPAAKVKKITEATAVVRELVRRASTPPDEAPSAAGADSSAVEADAASDAPPKAVDAAADAAVKAAAKAAKTDEPEAPQVVATALTTQAAALSKLIAATPATTVAVTPALTPDQIAAKKAAAAKADAQHLAQLAASTKAFGNGQIPQSLLRPIPWAGNHVLRADAAIQLGRLNTAFAARFGMNLGITDAYRSYADQVATKAARGYWAAAPGTSNHGWGVAVDLGSGISSFGSDTYRWMAENAGKFGWVNPDWAQPGGSKPEPWHWEYQG
ncbi:D-alanyl-D-alanine carboxypeptidase family protein [Xylanimonas sp. McL0601]|uniref:M15 family metallopeptidase n=1 Tax=Xylanimonas sp. McL0601 TaxID=3414739 RepID=UPI003CEFDE81